MENTFDNNHVFILPHNGGTLYLPFVEVSHVFDSEDVVRVITKTGKEIVLAESAVCDEFMMEYKGCVGLEVD